MLLVGRQEGHPACKKTERWGAGMVIYLERGAHLHMAQLMPLPLTVLCFSKIQIGFTFPVPLTLVVLDKVPLNGCVCVNWIINDSFELCEFLDTTQQNCHRPAYGNGKVEDHQCAGTCSLGKYVGNDGRSDRGVASLADTDQGTQQHKQPEILHTHTCTHTHTHTHRHTHARMHARTHTHTHLTVLFLGLPG